MSSLAQYRNGAAPSDPGDDPLPLPAALTTDPRDRTGGERLVLVERELAHLTAALRDVRRELERAREQIRTLERIVLVAAVAGGGSQMMGAILEALRTVP